MRVNRGHEDAPSCTRCPPGGEAAILLRQIALKLGPPSEGVRARIEAADADNLLDWSARILTAERVDDIFR
jgi:hypothetical protein